MTYESIFTVQMVNGGFILAVHSENAVKTEVFTSQGKLMKAIRNAIDEGSLVKKEKDEGVDKAE